MSHLCKRLRPFGRFFLCSVRLEEGFRLVSVLPSLYKPVRRAGHAVKNPFLLPVPNTPAQNIADSRVINWKLLKDQMRYIIAVYGAPVPPLASVSASHSSLRGAKRSPASSRFLSKQIC